MIREAFILSLQITAIYLLFQQGMLLGWLRISVANLLDWFFVKDIRISRLIQKPFWDCLTCMAGIWTIILTGTLNFKLILWVCTMNAFIDKLLNYEGSIRG